MDYNSSLLALFFTTPRFSHRYGACLIEEAELFPCARTICKARGIDSNLLENARFLDRAGENIMCRAVVSSFATVATTGVEFQRQPLLKCRHCRLQSSRVASTEGRTFFCLDAEGTRVHLLSFSNATAAQRQKRKAILILTFPPGETY